MTARTQHTHELALRFQSECAACEAFRHAVILDTATMIDCAVNPEFRAVSFACRKLQKHLAKIEGITREWDGWLSGEFAVDFDRSFKALKAAVARIEKDYPRACQRRKEAVLEFLLASYCNEYACDPPKLHFSLMTSGNNRSGKVEGNEITTFFKDILSEAQKEAKVIDKARSGAVSKPTSFRLPKGLSFSTDFGETVRAIIKRWGKGGIPKPAELFALRGDLDAWSL